MLKKTLRDGYDCLQLIVFGNVAWWTAWLLPFFVSTVVWPKAEKGQPMPLAQIGFAIGLGLLVAAFIVGPVTMGLAALARVITRRQDPRLVDFFHGFRRFYLRGTMLFAVNAVITMCWGANLVFWSSSGPGGERLGQIGSFALLSLLSYAMLYWVLMQLYCPAFIVREDIGVLRAVRRSALLVLGNIGYSAGVFAQLAIIAAAIALPFTVQVQLLMGVSVMLAGFLYVAFAMLLGAAALEDLMQKYEGEDEEAEEPADEDAAEDDS